VSTAGLGPTAKKGVVILLDRTAGPATVSAAAPRILPG
jgi:hypothetical protein